MKKKGRSCIAWVLAMCLVCSMTGCSKKNVTDELKELNNEGQAESGEKGESGEAASALSAALAKKLDIPSDALKYEVRLDGRKTEYKVDAEVEIPATEKVGVYEEQLLDLTEDKVISYAKNLFDGGNYEQKKPYAACTKEELEALKRDAQKAMTEAQNTYVEDKWHWEEKIDELDFYLKHYIEPKENYGAGKYYNCQYYEAAKTDDDLAGYLLYYSRIMILEGAIGGTPYQLVAYQADPEYGDCVNSYLKLYRENETWSQCSWQASTSHFSMSENSMKENPVQENICEFTAEEAANSAKNCMSMMGFENMEIVHTEWLYWQRTPVESQSDDGYIAQIVPDGYSFYMARSCNGISGVYMPMGMEWLSADGSSYAEQEVYVVNVGSEGIVNVECGPLYENTTAISEDAEMLSFDAVNEKAKEAFEEEIGKLAAPEEETEGDAGEGAEGDVEEGTKGGAEGDVEEGCVPVERGVVNIKWVKLAYMNLQYDGKFRLTPVWVFASYTNEMQYPEVIISALDGTRVKENDNVYKCIQ